MLISKDVVDEIEREVVELFPEKIESKRGRYRERGWIFPNHLLIAVDIAKELSGKYGGDFEVCRAALLLHDTGLVYKREGSPLGHEKRSVDFANIILDKYNVGEETRMEIVNCIIATDPDSDVKSVNEKIVSSSDALSQINSLHFFAKAYFAEEFDLFVQRFGEKLPKSLGKICFAEERDEAKVIIDFYVKLVDDFREINYKR